MKKWAVRWIKSRTLLFNSIMAGLMALEASFSLLQPVLPGDIYAWFSVILIVGNKVLRVFFTTQPINCK